MSEQKNLFFVLFVAKYGADINNGIKMFESLSKDNPDDKRDYIYYLAIAYCRIQDYQTAQKYVKAFLEIEPNNQQVLLIDVSAP
jgi:mitochondrial fission 1 protein